MLMRASNQRFGRPGAPTVMEVHGCPCATRRTRSRFVIAWLMCALAIGATFIPRVTDAADEAPFEYRAKAAFIYRFIQFAEWPKEAFSSANASIVVGVLGDSAISKALGSLKSMTAKGRRLEVKQLKGLEDIAKTHVLFVAESERKRVEGVLKTCRNAPILTVGETKEFAQLGGVINFYLKDRKIRFEVNLDATKRAKLKLSSKMLRLARIVRDKKE